MFTFVQVQTQYDGKQLFRQDKDSLAFFHQVQKALLNSLYQENLLSDCEYEQCCCYLKKNTEGFND